MTAHAYTFILRNQYVLGDSRFLPLAKSQGGPGGPGHEGKDSDGNHDALAPRALFHAEKRGYEGNERNEQLQVGGDGGCWNCNADLP